MRIGQLETREGVKELRVQCWVRRCLRGGSGKKADAERKAVIFAELPG